MRAYRIDGHMGRDVDVDVCLPCQSIWFDAGEHLQITPGATLTLFRVIGENVSRPQWRAGDLVYCPHCRGQLRRIQDLQRATHFEYLRCPNQHGRLTAFYEFLKEKDFIKPMSAEQLASLRKYIRTVNCSNCGGPVDLAVNAECAHCGSPITMLDLEQADRLIDHLRQADRTGQPVDPDLPLALARARQQTEANFRALGRDRGWDETRSLDVVGEGLASLWRLIKE